MEEDSQEVVLVVRV